MKPFITEEELLHRIEWKRIEMVLMASKTGITSKQTLKASKELDDLLNMHRNLYAFQTQST
ncbi:aspartyl-phosphate phosphatase Spo0E family protein [Bacillus sp. V33-4]|uniref:aspartyl-phosphate phosphatase Spo0E family protein n=1 Tax=Bacillus sp. V33-4 TaxID=2054169 RepID=UPI002155D1C8|nr:aspartyl-phosphate phosphatase Spo0E family protein [Bacillus sp. V33-4]